jgi:hypothetical protein
MMELGAIDDHGTKPLGIRRADSLALGAKLPVAHASFFDLDADGGAIQGSAEVIRRMLRIAQAAAIPALSSR